MFAVVLIGKEDFSNVTLLAQKLKSCDAVVHLAGMNRGDEAEIYQTNVGLTRMLFSALEPQVEKKRVIFLSSTHSGRDTAYGRSKRECERIIAGWGRKHAASAVSIVAPNIFGEFVRPYYNSAIATFSYELAENKESMVSNSGKVELVYVGWVTSLIVRLLSAVKVPPIEPIPGKVMSIGDVYNLLRGFRDEYRLGIIPLCQGELELRLFNTFRSYLYPNHFPVPHQARADSRGSFVEIAKSGIGGQTSFSTTYPGIIRGNHYHTRKIERFSVIQGEAIIRLRRLLSDQVIEYQVSGYQPVYVDMPTYYTHSIQNVGQGELLTMFWVNEPFDLKDPDTYAEPVMV